MLAEGPVRELLRNLRTAGVEAVVYSDVQADPTDKNVEGALSVLREHAADGVIAVGGAAL